MKQFLILLLLAIPLPVLAISGACSSHGGVNCSVKNFNGTVICIDGWNDSSVTYQSVSECINNCQYPVSSGCTTQSDYNLMQSQLIQSGTSRYAGEYASGNLSSCTNQINDYQTKLQAYNSCLSQKPTIIFQTSQPSVVSTTSCVDTGRCNKTAWLTYDDCQKLLGTNSLLDTRSNQCLCLPGYFNNGVTCSSHNVDCTNKFGLNAYWNGDSNECDCNGKLCVKSTVLQKNPLLTKSLKIGSRDAEVTTLQNFLISNNFLKIESLGYFGTGTRTAVIKFQRAKHLKLSGWVDQKTLDLINNW